MALLDSIPGGPQQPIPNLTHGPTPIGGLQPQPAPGMSEYDRLLSLGVTPENARLLAPGATPSAATLTPQNPLNGFIDFTPFFKSLGMNVPAPGNQAQSLLGPLLNTPPQMTTGMGMNEGPLQPNQPSPSSGQGLQPVTLPPATLERFGPNQLLIPPRGSFEGDLAGNLDPNPWGLKTFQDLVPFWQAPGGALPFFTGANMGEMIGGQRTSFPRGDDQSIGFLDTLNFPLAGVLSKETIPTAAPEWVWRGDSGSFETPTEDWYSVGALGSQPGWGTPTWSPNIQTGRVKYYVHPDPTNSAINKLAEGLQNPDTLMQILTGGGGSGPTSGVPTGFGTAGQPGSITGLDPTGVAQGLFGAVNPGGPAGTAFSNLLSLGTQPNINPLAMALSAAGIPLAGPLLNMLGIGKMQNPIGQAAQGAFPLQYQDESGKMHDISPTYSGRLSLLGNLLTGTPNFVFNDAMLGSSAQAINTKDAFKGAAVPTGMNAAHAITSAIAAANPQIAAAIQGVNLESPTGLALAFAIATGMSGFGGDAAGSHMGPSGAGFNISETVGKPPRGYLDTPPGIGGGGGYGGPGFDFNSPNPDPGTGGSAY